MLFWLRKRIRWKPEGIDSSLPPIRKAINPSTMMRMLIPDLFIQQRPASCAASTLINWISTHVGLRKRELFHNDDSFFPHIFILIYDSSIRSSLSLSFSTIAQHLIVRVKNFPLRDILKYPEFSKNLLHPNFHAFIEILNFSARCSRIFCRTETDFILSK